MKQSATLDTSFWINAHRSGLAPYVLDRFRLTAASEVAEELVPAFESGREFWRLRREGVVTLQEASSAGVREFGRGERGAMNLALEHPDWLLLIDDRRPLEAAVQLGLRVLCTPVLAVQLYGQGALSGDSTLRILATLAAMGTVSPTLLSGSLAQLGQIWRRRGG